MNRKVPFAAEEYYHIYNRGNDKRIIFLEAGDYHRFIRLLFFANSHNPVDFRLLNKGVTFVDYAEKRGETLVDIGAYCLMPNHFHLLVRSKDEAGLSLFMKKVGTSYSMYFNAKNARTGKLFEGAFRSSHVDSDEYLKYLFAYIHLNPIKIIEPEWKEKGLTNTAAATEFLNSYLFSSHSHYINAQKDDPVLNKSVFPDYFHASHSLDEYQSYIQDWLTIPIQR